MSVAPSMTNPYGWTFGPANITRIHSDPKLGAWLQIDGRLERIEIRVTKGGCLRVGPVIKRKENKK